MGHVVAPAADLVFDTIALVVSGSVAALAWVRYRESHLPIALYEAAAFLALTIADATAVAVAVRSSGVTDASIAVVGQSQFFVWAVARVLAAGLLVFGGAATLRGHVTRHPLAILFLPTALMLGVVVLAEMSGSQLPSLMATITPGSSPSDAPDLPVTAVGGTVLAMNAVLFLVSAALCRELARRGSRGDAYVAVGLVFAAFAQLHDALFPSTHPQEVASGDLLVLAFALVLLLGVEAEARFTLRALRHANESLERLRDAEVDRAVLEERARLSRELHDGLAQDLWLAKLKAGRLAALPDLGPEATLLSEELGSAIDSGLAEAREAVMALRLGAGAADGAFGGLIRRVVDDFQDRFGLRAELERDDDLPSIPSRARSGAAPDHPGGAQQCPPACRRDRGHGGRPCRGRSAHRDHPRQWEGLRHDDRQGTKLRAVEHAGTRRAHRGHADDRLGSVRRDHRHRRPPRLVRGGRGRTPDLTHRGEGPTPPGKRRHGQPLCRRHFSSASTFGTSVSSVVSMSNAIVMVP